MTAGFVAVDIASLMKEATLRCVERMEKTMLEEGK